MKIMHWNYFNEFDKQSGAKRYEDELFNNMSLLDVSRIQKGKGNIFSEAGNFKIDNSYIVHATFQPLAPLKLIKKPKHFVLTVHDIIPKFHYSNLQKLRHMWYLIEYAIPKADKILVYSEFNKNELINRLRVKEHKIHVVPLGVGSEYKPMDKDECINFFNLNENTKHILVVSSNAPWKNMQLVNKIISLMNELKLFDYKIVKIGYGETLDTPGVINLGYIEEQHMSALYNACDLFLQPSLNEGGLPALEAMACGCPVISADAASLPEIIGDGGILLNASDNNCEYGFISSIRAILENDYLKNELVNKGLKRASEFPWSRTAKETIEVYKKCLND